MSVANDRRYLRYSRAKSCGHCRRSLNCRRPGLLAIFAATIVAPNGTDCNALRSRLTKACRKDLCLSDAVGLDQLPVFFVRSRSDPPLLFRPNIVPRSSIRTLAQVTLFGPRVFSITCALLCAIRFSQLYSTLDALFTTKAEVTPDSPISARPARSFSRRGHFPFSGRSRPRRTIQLLHFFVFSFAVVPFFPSAYALRTERPARVPPTIPFRHSHPSSRRAPGSRFPFFYFRFSIFCRDFRPCSGWCTVPLHASHHPKRSQYA